jgi:hypothetical protein
MHLNKSAASVAVVAVGCIAPTAASLILAQPASAKASLKATPHSPIVDDDVTVSWRADRNLKPGYHYEGNLVARGDGDCASFVFKDSTRKPRKGTSMSFKFSPYDDRLTDASEWCQGKASIIIRVVKDGADSGTIVGQLRLRFRGKP